MPRRIILTFPLLAPFDLQPARRLLFLSRAKWIAQLGYRHLLRGGGQPPAA